MRKTRAAVDSWLSLIHRSSPTLAQFKCDFTLTGNAQPVDMRSPNQNGVRLKTASDISQQQPLRWVLFGVSEAGGRDLIWNCYPAGMDIGTIPMELRQEHCGGIPERSVRGLCVSS